MTKNHLLSSITAKYILILLFFRQTTESFDSNNNQIDTTETQETEVGIREDEKDQTPSPKSNHSKKQVTHRLGKFIRSLGQSRKASYELVNVNSLSQNPIESSVVAEPLRNRFNWWSLRAPKIDRNDSKRQRKVKLCI